MTEDEVRLDHVQADCDAIERDEAIQALQDIADEMEEQESYASQKDYEESNE